MGGLTEPQKQSNNFPAFLSLLTWNPALVRLVPGVSPDVLLQVGELGELALADLTTVRLDPQVDSRVLRQVGAVGERLVARRALVRLRLAHVDLGVQLQIRLRRKDLKNVAAVSFHSLRAVITFSDFKATYIFFFSAVTPRVTRVTIR